ncbi:MAG: hypothetical protein OEV64_03590 [Desulfobulbaceae bacterium]|nr:hypothetical protein [Desulfobulbaceae bacterium]
MKVSIVTITDTEDTARAFDLYVRIMLPQKAESSFMTYRRSLLSRTLVLRADIFVLELFSMDNLGPRAEGIITAEKWLSLGKRALVVSGEACSDIIQCPLYWDLAAKDDLKDRIMALAEAPLSLPSELNTLRTYFSKFYRRAEDPHLK